MPFQSNNEIRQYIYKVFGKNIEIREARYPLRLQPIPADMDGADPKDPSNCVFVHTVKRMYGSQVVIFWKHIAYLDMRDNDGIRRVYRFAVTRTGTQRLCKFDHGEPFPLGSAITLMPATKSQTLSAVRKSAQRRKKQQKQYGDRRKRLQSSLKNASKKLEREEQQLTEIMANELQDTKKIAAVKRRKKVVEASISKIQVDLQQMDAAKSQRAPKKFDLTTRNGVFGRYNFSNPPG
jgi:hypothetical protein